MNTIRLLCSEPRFVLLLCIWLPVAWFRQLKGLVRDMTSVTSIASGPFDDVIDGFLNDPDAVSLFTTAPNGETHAIQRSEGSWKGIVYSAQRSISIRGFTINLIDELESHSLPPDVSAATIRALISDDVAALPWIHRSKRAAQP